MDEKRQRQGNMMGQLANLRQLQEEVQTLKANIGDVSSRADAMARKTMEAKAEVASYVRKCGTDPTPEQVSIIEKLRRNEADLQVEWDKAAKEDEAIQDRIRQLEAEIVAIGGGATIESVLDFLAVIEGKSQEIEKIEAMIAEQTLALEQAPGKTSHAEDFQQAREDLLAKVALGSATQEDLNDLDSRIKKHRAQQKEDEKKSAEARETIDQARQLIAGLNRRLENLQEEVRSLKAQQPMVYLLYLRTEAEATAHRYVKHAESLVVEYRRLLALGNLIETNPANEGRSKILGHAWNSLSLPSFNLAACKAVSHPASPGVLLRHLVHDCAGAALAEEKGRLRSLGLCL